MRSLARWGRGALRRLYHSSVANLARRLVNYRLVYVRCRLLGPAASRPLKLHLGCGHQSLQGFVNVDHRKTEATDLVCDIRRLPYPAKTAHRIEAYHVIEHIPRPQVVATLLEWYRVLVPGGVLVLEFPDLDAMAAAYLDGEERMLDGIYGHQRFEGDTHLFGYNAPRMTALLEGAGYTNVIRRPAVDYHAATWPCLRVEGQRPER